jgi:uncharacterized protein YkwD
MIRIFTLSLAFAVSAGAPPAKNPKPKPARVVTVSAPVRYEVSPDYDVEAERRLLEMANQARAQAGLPFLQSDDGLTQAARVHAAGMASEQVLSHQLSGESSLSERLGSNSSLHLEAAGENVASAPTIDEAQAGLMQSPPHRENLLNAGYNVAGFAVVHSGDKLYVVQDFGRTLPTYSGQASEDMVAASVTRIRAEANLQSLHRLDGNVATKSACEMAQADSLNTRAPSARYILRYTSMQLDTLPTGASQALSDGSLRSFAVGSCYSRTTTYPNGVYWVTLLFF